MLMGKRPVLEEFPGGYSEGCARGSLGRGTVLFVTGICAFVLLVSPGICATQVGGSTGICADMSGICASGVLCFEITGICALFLSEESPVFLIFAPNSIKLFGRSLWAFARMLLMVPVHLSPGLLLSREFSIIILAREVSLILRFEILIALAKVFATEAIIGSFRSKGRCLSLIFPYSLQGRSFTLFGLSTFGSILP